MNKESKKYALKDQSFPVVWANAYSEKKEKTFNLGVCGHYWKPAFIGSDIEAITISDFHLDEQTGTCEEGLCCLNVNCRFNMTTPKSYAVSKGLDSDHSIKKLKKMWAGITRCLASYQQIADMCKKAYDKDPNVRAIEFPKRRGCGDGK